MHPARACWQCYPAVLKRTTLVYSPQDSIANMRVLDALSEAARTGNAVSL